MDISIHHGDCEWFMTYQLERGAVNCIITDPPYDGQVPLAEFGRVCQGNIVCFCSPENRFFKPDEIAYWIKTPSTKNYSKHLGHFVEEILILRQGTTFNVLHWSQMTGVYDDRLVEPPVHPYEKPLSLIERLVRIYSKPGDLVFDPYMGSGVVGVACRNLGRSFVGCEIDRTYFELAKANLGI